MELFATYIDIYQEVMKALSLKSRTFSVSFIQIHEGKDMCLLVKMYPGKSFVTCKVALYVAIVFEVTMI